MSDTVIFPTTGESIEGEQLRRLDGKRIREAREERGLSRASLSSLVGMHESQLGKIERGEVKTTTEERARALAQNLYISVDEVGEPLVSSAHAPPLASESERPPIVIWAQRRGVSRKYAGQLARLGRIEGAYKGPWPGYNEDVWIMDPDAAILPPTEEQREIWRSTWTRRNRSEEQRRRRQRQKEESNG